MIMKSSHSITLLLSVKHAVQGPASFTTAETRTFNAVAVLTAQISINNPRERPFCRAARMSRATPFATEHLCCQVAFRSSACCWVQKQGHAGCRMGTWGQGVCTSQGVTYVGHVLVAPPRWATAGDLVRNFWFYGLPEPLFLRWGWGHNPFIPHKEPK